MSLRWRGYSPDGTRRIVDDGPAHGRIAGVRGSALGGAYVTTTVTQAPKRHKYGDKALPSSTRTPENQAVKATETRRSALRMTTRPIMPINATTTRPIAPMMATSTASLRRECRAMTEEALFYGYRNAEGYSAECACGDTIHSQFGTEAAISNAILIHQSSTVHQQWREWQEAVHALQRPTRHPCPCHEHGGVA